MVALKLSFSGSAVYIPLISGWATRSNASRPSRRETKDARLSSSCLGARGSTKSRAIRNFPRQENSGDLTNGKNCVGASIKKPSGIGSSLPRCTKKVLRCASLVGMRWESKPIRLHRASAHGLVVMNESGPSSMRKPFKCRVAIAPPSCLLPSSRRTSSGRFFSKRNSTRR